MSMWVWLGFGILCEVSATIVLRTSDGFTRLFPTLTVLIGYGLAIFALSRSLLHGMGVGHAYAIWAGVGVASIAVIGVVFFGERFSVLQVGGIAFIVVGVLALELGASR